MLQCRTTLPLSVSCGRLYDIRRKVRITLTAGALHSPVWLQQFSKFEEDWTILIADEENGSDQQSEASYNQRGIKRSVFMEWAPGAQLHFASGPPWVGFRARVFRNPIHLPLRTVVGHEACQCNTSAKALCMHYSILNVNSVRPFCPRRVGFGGRERKIPWPQSQLRRLWNRVSGCGKASKPLLSTGTQKVSLIALHVILAHVLQGGGDQMSMNETNQLTGRLTGRGWWVLDLVSPASVSVVRAVSLWYHVHLCALSREHQRVLCENEV